MTQGFQAWLGVVNQILLGMCGMTSDDLPDASYHDWYDAGLSGKEAAVKALKNAGFEE